ncbi:HK97 family phage prohead protease [Thalassobius sp. Cn5-15]|uniref:HK97 family phage prohead protease n=1 Tax=Thalassobius sp. Cn5-15 TaxID=2917763 RepID=UPI001EF2493E|nr:HK97 family phage prohead protease [Thalassobius sp. Cn5-15]MCG7492068.1 HK97 family phage prohead protease [Thalassobius sp. Cn5-15]
MLEHKFTQHSNTLVVEDEGVISGYASLFDHADQGGDLVRPGAFAASLKRLAAAGSAVKMLWQHDPAQPIGIWDDIREDARGLWVKGRLLPGVARAREAQALIAAGAIDGLSIGYRTERASKAADGTRHLQQLDLWEVSLVTFPMLPTARLNLTGKGRDPDTLAMLCTALRQAGAEMHPD